MKKITKQDLLDLIDQQNEDLTLLRRQVETLRAEVEALKVTSSLPPLSPWVPQPQPWTITWVVSKVHEAATPVLDFIEDVVPIR